MMLSEAYFPYVFSKMAAMQKPVNLAGFVVIVAKTHNPARSIYTTYIYPAVALCLGVP